MKPSFCCVLLLAMFGVGTVVAQTGQVVRGTPPFGSFGGGPDVINLGNLNAHFTIPVFSRAGRGMPFSFDLSYDTSVWYPSSSSGSLSWTPVTNWGWTGTDDLATAAVGKLTAQVAQFHCSGTNYYYAYFWTFTDKSGVPHIFDESDKAFTCGTTTTLNMRAYDGSGYYISVTGSGPGTVTWRSGTQLGTSGAQTDNNGNKITVSGSSVSDTLSTSPVLTASGTPAAPPVKYGYTNPLGGTSYVTVGYVNHTVQTAFGCSGTGEYSHTAIPLVDTVTMPDGSTYAFTYEPTPGHTGQTVVTGRVASVTLPTGGSISYAYTGGSHGINCADGTASGFTRTVSPGGTWTYTHTQVSGKHWQTNVTTPPDPTVGNNTVIDFQQDSGSTTNFYEVQRKTYQGSGTLLLTQMNCYNGNFGACVTTAVTNPISQLDAYRQLAGGQTSAVETTFNASTLPTGTLEYDLGVTLGSAPSSTYLRRNTIINYASLGGGMIVDHPSQVTVKDGSGTIKAQTTYNYGNTVTGTTGTPQHTTPPYTDRGNLTSVSSLTTGASTLSKSFTYYDTGNINVATDVNGATTTYKYGSGTSCGNSFPTEIDLPITSPALLTQYTWNCTGGVTATSTDVNGRPTTYEFADPNYWRLTKVDKPNGGSTTYTYNTSTAPWDIATSSQQTSTASVTNDTVFDGLGRVSKTELTSDPVDDDVVDTAYDTLGRVASVSNPHRSTSSPTDGTTSYTYDALGRTTLITLPGGATTGTVYYHNSLNRYSEGIATQEFMQVDGLGRLTSVCERALSGTGALANGDTPIATYCNSDYYSYPAFKTTYAYDVLNNITLVTQNDQNGGPTKAQTRSYTYDGLSRLTKEINPETGEIDYAYDSLHGGDLYRRTGGEPNNATGATSYASYTFDLMHRITSIGYSDPYTPSKFFYWDTQSWWNAVTPNYPKGRLARQTSSTCGTDCAGEFYNYDIDGNIAGKATWTPSNIGSAVASYYQYNLLDQQTSMTDVRGTVYTTVYDAAGRPTSLTSTLSDTTHPPTLYTVNSYNPLGEITSSKYGITGAGTTATAHTATFDNRGRLLTVYDAVTAGLPYSLTVTYSKGRVASANDSVNGNWSSFTYDDFNNLKSSWCGANCPDGTNAEGYNYGYDEFGNRWTQTLATGSGPGPQPSYSFDRNNRFTPTDCSHGTGNFCYDSAGNLKYDSAGGNWSFDFEGIIFGYDSTSEVARYSSDALGQRLHRVLNGVVYDYVFDNEGKENIKYSGGFVGWNWSNLFFGGGHVATYASSSTYFSHTDHLGSERVETDPTGNTNASEETNLPFGEWTSSGMQNELGFTGDLLDNADGNAFHTPTRPYNPTQGRWMHPDPVGLAAVDPANPQTWNRYAYATNNPTSFVDPSGLEMRVPCGGVWSNTDCSDGGGNGFGCNPSWENPICISSGPIGGGLGFPGGGSGGSNGNGGGGSSGSSGSSAPPWQEWGNRPPWGNHPLDLAGLLGLTPGMGCDFGSVCVPIGSGFASAVTGAGTPNSPFTINVLVLAPYLQICGDFWCDPTSGRQYGPTNIGLSEDIGTELAIAGLATDIGATLGEYGFNMGIHGPHHFFPGYGRVPHFQINWWKIGVRGSGGAWRWPWPF